MNETKVCTKCKRELPLSEFSPDVAYKGGHKTWCKDCYKKVRQEWYAKNRAVANEKKRISQQKRREFEQGIPQAAGILGGWKMYYLNHPKRGEFAFNAVSTAGDVFKTNDKKEFLRFVAEL